MAKKKNIVIHWLNEKLQVVIYKADNYNAINKIRIKRLSIVFLIILTAIFFFILSSLIFFFTPIKQSIPGYPDKESENTIYESHIRVDSLLIEIEKNEQYLAAIKNFIFNQVPIDQDLAIPISAISPEQIEIFNNPTIAGETYIPKVKTHIEEVDSLTLQLFSPLRNAVIQARFAPSQKHYGIDLASSDQTIYACSDGMVISSNYTIETGYVIIVQHKSNLISTYKHNEICYVEAGNYVTAGQPIAKYGDCGEYTNGPHIHFELWLNGIAVNPEDYIQF